MPKFGIIQGRLTASPPGCLQWFPQKEWRQEFVSAASLGLNFIELIAEEQQNENNPFWTKAGCDEIRSLATVHGLDIFMACNDFVIAHSIFDTATANQVSRFIERCRYLDLQNFVLPLFGKSEIQSHNTAEFIPVVKAIAKQASTMTVHLETLLPAKALVEFVKSLNCSNIGVVYDIGNRAASNTDIISEIKLLGNLISHIHIKDKTSDNENVLLGSGNADFPAIFDAIAQINYQGAFTFETTRGVNPIETARTHLDFAKSLLSFGN